MTTYKKYILVISLSLLLIMIPSSAFAADSSTEPDFPSDMDIKSISDEIITCFNSTLAEEIGREINESDIDFSKAYKFYIGTNLFEESTTNFNDAVKILEEQGYLYEIPIIVVNDTTYIAVISKGYPVTQESRESLTAEEIAELEKIVGKWHVEGFNMYGPDSPFIDYYSIAEKVSGISNTSPIFVRDLPIFGYAVALYPDENGDIATLVPLSPGMVDWAVFSDDPDGKNKPLDYMHVKNIVKNLPAQNSEESGGGFGAIVEKSNINIWYIVGVVIILIAAIIIINRIRKNKSNN